MDSTSLTKMKMISDCFDRNFNQLKELVNNPIPLQDSVQSDSVSKLTEAIDRVDQEIKSLKKKFQETESISSLRSRIQAAFKREEIMDKVVEIPVSTPLKIVVAEPFEDFPNSPTLEQLGLSGPTLSIVGKRTGFDSSASMSDGEFDNSFYQKSPISVNDNSFSSDVSVPNFRILNSSPRISTGISNNSRPKSSHNLKQVTTVIDFSNSEDSSIIIEPSNPIKRVHFAPQEESENCEISNNK